MDTVRMLSYAFQNDLPFPRHPAKSPLKLALYCHCLPLQPSVSSTPTPMSLEPEKWPAAKVRQTFIDYFSQKPGYEHVFWPSSNVVPHDDPSLLFVNAVSRVPPLVTLF